MQVVPGTRREMAYNRHWLFCTGYSLCYILAMNNQALKKRRKTRVVMVGDVEIGGDNPVRVQTMTNTDTLDIDATVKQVNECAAAGAELVRITTPTVKHVYAFKEIKKQVNVPLVADIHFIPDAAFAALKVADKIRLNPGNTFKDHDELVRFINEAKEAGVAVRIGANHGSLSERILEKYGNTPEGIVNSVMEHARIFKENNFDDLIVSVKASDPLVMIEANRFLVAKMDEEGMDYPIHLGVTEAGNASEGRAKSTIGIGTLLLEGIGDTVRVSLTEDPVKEIPVCYDILQATRRRITKTEFISCPSCGRTMFDIEKVTNIIKEKMGHLKGVRIAIMGCVVNGPGEMNEADFGYVGAGPGTINLYKGNEVVKKNISEERAVEELINLIKEEGQWVD